MHYKDHFIDNYIDFDTIHKCDYLAESWVQSHFFAYARYTCTVKTLLLIFSRVHIFVTVTYESGISVLVFAESNDSLQKCELFCYLRYIFVSGTSVSLVFIAVSFGYQFQLIYQSSLFLYQYVNFLAKWQCQFKPLSISFTQQFVI